MLEIAKRNLRKILFTFGTFSMCSGVFLFSNTYSPLTTQEVLSQPFDKTLDILSEKAAPHLGKVASAKRYIYPYHEAPHELLLSGDETIKIFSYGSLMDRNSAARTLTESSLATYSTAIGFGAKRIFDRDVPVNINSTFGRPLFPLSRGMLNLMMTNNPMDRVNGAVFEIPIEELLLILHREDGYDLAPILITHCNDMSTAGHTFEIAYTFHAPQTSFYTSDHIFPRPNYYELTRNAAKSLGKDHEQMWFETTYLADGTPIAKWEEQVARRDLETAADSDDPPF